MLAFTSFEDATPSSLSLGPFLRLNDTSHVVAFWFLIGFLYHTIVKFAVRGGWREHLKLPFALPMAVASFKDSVCPKRRARWYKCSHRCARRRRHCTESGSNNECPISKCVESLFKMYLPPPLPLRCREKTTREVADTSEPKDSKEEGDMITTSAEKTTSVASNEKPTEKSSKHVAQRLAPTIAIQPKTPLIDLARMQQWNTILQGVSRREAKYRDIDGLYPLHWACSAGPPAEVVQLLLDTYPSAARKFDTEGSMPLHFAAHYSASASVMEALLKSYPKAIRMQDKYGRSPLYHAVDKSASMEVLKTLVKADPSMVTTPCLPANSRQQSLSRATAIRTPLSTVWAAVVMDRRTREQRQGRKWDKAMMLLEAAHCHHSNLHPAVPRSFRILPAALSLDIYLPDQVVSMALLSHPDQVKETDEVTGQLPLSLAAATSQYSPERSDNLIELLLEAYPQAAVHRDNQGRSALVHALDAGKKWNAGIERLFYAAPEALTWRDALSGLMPVLVAASAPIKNNVTAESDTELPDSDPFGLLGSKHHEWVQSRQRLEKPVHSSLSIDPNTERIDTVFRLMQADPTVVATFTS